jgi:hypothetical protein
MVRFEKDPSDDERRKWDKINNNTPAYDYGIYPVKLLTFFCIRGSKSIFAVVHCTDIKYTSEEDSVLTEKWYLEYENRRNEPHQHAILRVIEIESIHDSIYVVQETPGFHPILDRKNMNQTNLVVLVKKRHTWSQFFT